VLHHGEPDERVIYQPDVSGGFTYECPRCGEFAELSLPTLREARADYVAHWVARRGVERLADVELASSAASPRRISGR
jgi:hypothetical protein